MTRSERDEYLHGGKPTQQNDHQNDGAHACPVHLLISQELHRLKLSLIDTSGESYP